MKKNILLLFLVLNVYSLYSLCSVKCKARYLFKKDGIPTWSNTFLLDVTFTSGYEANKSIGKQIFNDNLIISHLFWETGGVSIFKLDKWTTNEMYLTKRELMVNNKTGEKIITVYGTESNIDRYWEITFLE